MSDTLAKIKTEDKKIEESVKLIQTIIEDELDAQAPDIDNPNSKQDEELIESLYKINDYAGEILEQSGNIKATIEVPDIDSFGCKKYRRHHKKGGKKTRKSGRKGKKGKKTYRKK